MKIKKYRNVLLLFFSLIYFECNTTTINEENENEFKLVEEKEDILVFEKTIQLNEFTCTNRIIHKGNYKEKVFYINNKNGVTHLKFSMNESYKSDSLYDINKDGFIDLIIINKTTGPNEHIIHLGNELNLLNQKNIKPLYNYVALKEKRFVEIINHQSPCIEIRYKEWINGKPNFIKVCYLLDEEKFYCFEDEKFTNCIGFHNDDVKKDLIIIDERITNLLNQNKFGN